MTCAEMREWRARAKLSQLDLALLMGMSHRGYHDLETGKVAFNERHAMLLERASLTLAIERRDPELALPSIRNECLELYALQQMAKQKGQPR